MIEARHLAAVEEALLPHHVFQKSDLTFVDEQHEFAGFFEIDLSREKR